MTRLERNVNLAAVILPFAAVIIGGVLLWRSFLDWRDIAIFIVMYALTAGGVTVGFHRLLTHRAFKTRRWVRALLAILGSMAVQGPVIDWVADHRKHHTFTDEDGDPHSPHAGRGAGLAGTVHGLWHAHVGWLFSNHGQAPSARFARDLRGERSIRTINRGFPALALASLAIPFLAGLALGGGSLSAGLSALLWGGLVRIFLLHHVTWSINSICHFFGRRRFATEDRSTNVFWLALPSLGEAWHHNHHAFPRSAFHGMRWWELDPSGWLILAMSKVGLAWDVVRVGAEAQRTRLAGAAAHAHAAVAEAAAHAQDAVSQAAAQAHAAAQARAHAAAQAAAHGAAQAQSAAQAAVAQAGGAEGAAADASG